MSSIEKAAEQDMSRKLAETQRQVRVLEAENIHLRKNLKQWHMLFRAEIERNKIYSEVLLGKMSGGTGADKSGT